MNEEEIIIGKAYTYFAIDSDSQTEVDFFQWLGIEPDSFETIETIHGGWVKTWKITTPMTEDPYLHPMIRGIMDRLLPIKDRLIAFKRAYPDLHYKLQVVLWQGHGTAGLSLDNDTLLFLGEIGALLDCDIYRQ